MARLEGRTALITGAASGIGQAQVQTFAREGAKVIACDLNGAAAETSAAEVVAAGGDAIGLAMDVTDPASVQAAVAAGLEHFARIDILCNTAGAFDDNVQALDTSDELWGRLFEVNVRGVHNVCTAVLPQMIENGGGSVVNIASTCGLIAGGGGAAYTASKHAVVGYTKQLAAAYGKSGVRVNAIAPGLIDTPMVAAMTSSPDVRGWIESQPAGRVGTPQDVADASLFLAGPESDYIHAVTLSVDGGLINTL